MKPCFAYIFVSAHKRSLGQVNVFTPVCHYADRGMYPSLEWGGVHPPWQTAPWQTPQEDTPPPHASYWNALLFKNIPRHKLSIFT